MLLSRSPSIQSLILVLGCILLTHPAFAGKNKNKDKDKDKDKQSHRKIDIQVVPTEISDPQVTAHTLKATIQDSYDRADRLYQVALQIEKETAETGTTVEEQNQQIAKIHRGVNFIKYHLKISKKHMDQVRHLLPRKKIRFLNPKDPRLEAVWKVSKKLRKKKKKEKEALEIQQVPQEDLFARLVKDFNLDEEDKEMVLETERKMEKVRQVLRTVRIMAQDVGMGVEESNEQLDTLIQSTRKAENNFETLTREADQYLGHPIDQSIDSEITSCGLRLCYLF
jgi:hypothetical protein